MKMSRSSFERWQVVQAVGVLTGIYTREQLQETGVGRALLFLISAPTVHAYASFLADMRIAHCKHGHLKFSAMDLGSSAA